MREALSMTQANEQTAHPELEALSVRIPDACGMLGVGRSKVYELLTSGELASIKIGASRLVIVASMKLLVERGGAA
jgi:excisionase family DNA binding protein